MIIKNKLQNIMKEISDSFESIDDVAVDKACETIVAAERIFVAGAGRTGLVMKMFAMRLAQAGLAVHFVGDVTTPSIYPGDLLIVGSGSGNTASMVCFAEKALVAGAHIMLLTRAKGSKLESFSTSAVHIPVPLAERPGGLGGAQILGTLFEQCLMILCDIMTIDICSAIGKENIDLQRMHANLE